MVVLSKFKKTTTLSEQLQNTTDSLSWLGTGTSIKKECMLFAVENIADSICTNMLM